MTHKEHLSLLLANGNLKQVIKELLEATNQANTIIMLSGRYNRNEKGKDSMDLRDYQIEFNKINNALVTYIEDDYADDGSYEFKPIQPISSKTPHNFIQNSITNLPIKMKHKVFISHNHGDNAVALAAQKLLEANDIEVIIDLENILAGDNIKAFLEKSIKECDVTLSIVSEKSLKSAWVAMESVNTFYAEKFAEKKFMAAFIDGSFFKRSYVNDTLDEIEKELKEIQEEIQRSLTKNRPIAHLQNELARYQDLNHNLSKIVERLKESLSTDISGDNFEKGMALIVKSIKQMPLANENSNRTTSQSNILVNGNNNTVISGVSGSHMNVNTPSNNPNPPINAKAEEICKLIDKDLDTAFEELDKHFKNDPVYKDLCDVYIHRPGNFTLNDFRSRLKTFVRQNLTT